MTPVVLDIERPHVLDDADPRGREGSTSMPVAGERRTLEDVLAGMSAALVCGQVVACPVCGGEMVPDPARGTGHGSGRCRGCGSRLS